MIEILFRPSLILDYCQFLLLSVHYSLAKTKDTKKNTKADKQLNDFEVAVAWFDVVLELFCCGGAKHFAESNSSKQLQL